MRKTAEAGLAEFCDVYCDEGYYTVAETRRILEAGLAAGLRPKIHVDAYADIGGSALAAALPVVSADHLNYTGRAAMRAYAEAGVVGVVMPGLDFAVRHPRPFDGPGRRAPASPGARVSPWAPAASPPAWPWLPPAPGPGPAWPPGPAAEAASLPCLVAWTPTS